MRAAEPPEEYPVFEQAQVDLGNPRKAAQDGDQTEGLGLPSSEGKN